MKIRIINPVEDNRWDEFVIEQSAATVFHTSAWVRAIIETYDYSPRYIILEDEDGKILAGFPLLLVKSWITGTRLVCLPFSDYCYPLSENPEHINSIVQVMKNEMKTGDASYVEIRGWPSDIPTDELGLLPFHYHLSHIVDLSQNIDSLEKSFSTNVRRSIRKALNNEVTIRSVEDEEFLKVFYRFNVITRKKNGVIPQPYSLFRSVFRNLILSNKGWLLVAEWQGIPIAATLLLIFKDTIYYKYNASDINHLDKCPNHLIIWEAIQRAYQNNLIKFDYGRCSPEDEGLRTFKTKWAARELDLPCYYYPVIKGTMTYSDTSLKYRAMNRVVEILPGSVLKSIGSMLYKHLG